MLVSGRLVLVALCLTWICASRIFLQAPNPPSSPIGSEPRNPCNVFQTQPAASSGCSPFNGFQLFDGVRGGRGASGLDIVGNPAAGDKPAEGEAGVSANTPGP